jgi:ABC-2 type transport system permease protein
MTSVNRTASGSPMRWLLADTMVFAGRNLAHVKELPEKLIEVTIQPVMFVLLFAYVFGGAIAVPGGNYREYLIAGIVVQSIAFGIMGPAITMATDLREGVVDRFLSLPTSRLAYLMGHVTAELCTMSLAITVLTVSGLIIGWRTHTSVVEVLGAFALLFLFAAAIIWTGTLIGLFVRSPDAVAGVVFTAIFPLTFLSNAFVPIGTLPTVLEYIAAWNPVSVLIAAVRELWGNPVAPVDRNVWPLENPVIASVVQCILLLVVIVPMTLSRFRARTAT